MNKRHVLYGSLGLLLTAIFLFVQMPASLLIAKLAPQLHPAEVHGVNGSLWSGKIRTLHYSGLRLHNITWQLSPWALLMLQARLNLQIDDENLQMQTQANMSLNGELDLTSASLHSSGKFLSNWLALPGMQVQGDFELNIKQASVLQATSHPQLLAIEGEAQWQQASIQTVLGSEDLGAYRLRMQGDNGVITGTVIDEGKVLDLHGSLKMTEQQLSVDVSVKHELRESLARFFKNFAQDDGSRYRLHWQKQLSTQSATASDPTP